MEGAAEYAGLHRSHFTKTFSSEFGISPAGYLLELKMKKAAHMLRETAFSATEIGLSLGFGDLCSFTRAFRRYYGLPPSRYRTEPL